MNPWPGAYFKYEGKTIKVLLAEYTEKEHKEPCGKLLGVNCEVACGSGTLIIKSLKPEGRPQMPAADYLRGISRPIQDIVFS